MGTKASRKAWLLRGVAALTAAMWCVLPAAQADASSDLCMSNSGTGGSQIVPGNSTVSVERQQAANTWQDWIWRGTDYKFPCPGNVENCTYSWGKVHATAYSVTVGGQITLGNATSPLKVWYNMLGNVIPNWSKSSIDETDYNFAITMKPGQTAYPYQYIERRWTQGYFKGAYVSENRSCKVYRSRNPRRPGTYVPGTMYYWDPNRTFGSWTANREVGRGYGYVVY